MRAIKTIKRWMLRSVLFLGISLSICAVVKLAIRSVAIEHIKSTQAELNVEFTGADCILVYIKSATETEYTFLEIIDTEETDVIMRTTITGLIPATEYEVIVEAVTDLDDLDNAERAEDSVTFTTLESGF